MTTLMVVVLVTVVIAFIFDIINGFHDAANSIATVVSTNVLTPRIAVIWAAFFNFIAMFIFAPKVANTISGIVKINPANPEFVYVVLAGLLGAILWNLMTWYWGIPSSSSHALIGGFTGAGLAFGGLDVINWSKIWGTALFIPLAPLIGFTLAILFMLLVYWLFQNWRPMLIDKFFRKGQLVSAALYSLGHGGNDAQKTMGVIVALLIAAGIYQPDVKLSLLDVKTAWIIWSCHIAMAIGTAFGGWRIVKTMGMKITKLKPSGGFAAETAGATTLFAATALGIPVSTTHTITGSIMGVGSMNKLSAVRWGVAKNVIWAWIITIPFAAGVSALCFWGLNLLHKMFGF